MKSLFLCVLFEDTICKYTNKLYRPYEGLNLANQKGQKLGVFGWNLEGIHFPFYW